MKKLMLFFLSICFCFTGFGQVKHKIYRRAILRDSLYVYFTSELASVDGRSKNYKVSLQDLDESKYDKVLFDNYDASYHLYKAGVQHSNKVLSGIGSFLCSAAAFSIDYNNKKNNNVSNNISTGLYILGGVLAFNSIIIDLGESKNLRLAGIKLSKRRY